MPASPATSKRPIPPAALWIPTMAFVALVVVLQWRGLPAIDTDSHRYLAGARHLLEHGSLLDVAPDGSLVPDSLRTPGYPGFLAVVGWLHGGIGTASANLKTVIYQSLLWWAAMMCLILVGIRRGRIQRPWILGLGLLVALLSPPVLVGSGQIMTDLPSAALNALGCAGLTLMVQQSVGTVGRQIRRLPGSTNSRWFTALGAGLAFGLASSMRPLGTYVPLLVAIAVVLWIGLSQRGALAQRVLRNTLGPLALAVGVAMVPPVYWMGRNLAHHGTTQQTSLSGLALMLHRQSEIQRRTPDSMAAPNSPLYRFWTEAQRTGDVYHADLVIQREFKLTPFQTSALLRQAGLKLILEAPHRWLAQTMVNSVNLICAPADGLTLLKTLVGPLAQFDKPLGAAVRDRDLLAVAVQVGLRGLGLILHGVLPALFLMILLRHSWVGGASCGTRRAWIARLPLQCVLLAISSLWLLGISVAVTVTYGRFALPGIPLILSLAVAAAMVPPRIGKPRP